MSATIATNVYKLRHCEGCEWLQPVNKQEFELFVFDGNARASSWTPVAMRRLKGFRGWAPSATS